MPDTREEAHRLWKQVGLQFQNENENDLKDQLDYLTEPPKYYPPQSERVVFYNFSLYMTVCLFLVERPNLGCRILVQRNISKLAPALARELNSWQADVRVRCSQLLCAIALHAEEYFTHHLQDLLPAMFMAARDEDNRVVVNVNRNKINKSVLSNAISFRLLRLVNYWDGLYRWKPGRK